LLRDPSRRLVLGHQSPILGDRLDDCRRIGVVQGKEGLVGRRELVNALENDRHVEAVEGIAAVEEHRHSLVQVGSIPVVEEVVLNTVGRLDIRPADAVDAAEGHSLGHLDIGFGCGLVDGPRLRNILDLTC